MSGTWCCRGLCGSDQVCAAFADADLPHPAHPELIWYAAEPITSLHLAERSGILLCKRTYQTQRCERMRVETSYTVKLYAQFACRTRIPWGCSRWSKASRYIAGLGRPHLCQVIAVSAPGTVTVVGRCGGRGMHSIHRLTRRLSKHTRHNMYIYNVHVLSPLDQSSPLELLLWDLRTQ